MEDHKMFKAPTVIGLPIDSNLNMFTGIGINMTIPCSQYEWFLFGIASTLNIQCDNFVLDTRVSRNLINNNDSIPQYQEYIEDYIPESSHGYATNRIMEMNANILYNYVSAICVYGKNIFWHKHMLSRNDEVTNTILLYKLIVSALDKYSDIAYKIYKLNYSYLDDVDNYILPNHLNKEFIAIFENDQKVNES